MLNPEVLKCHEDLITLETYAQLGKTMDNKFFICENINIFSYLGALGGLSSHPYLCTHQIRKQSDKKFLSLNPKYDKNIYVFHMWGVLGPHTSNPGEQKCQGSKTSSQSSHIYNNGTK